MVCCKVASNIMQWTISQQVLRGENHIVSHPEALLQAPMKHPKGKINMLLTRLCTRKYSSKRKRIGTLLQHVQTFEVVVMVMKNPLCMN
jgi:hypothetical protein